MDVKQLLEQLSLLEELTNYKNGTKINGWVMSNPNLSRGYITLSNHTKTYLQQCDGKGLVTSGAEGSHYSGKGITHGNGLKLDIQPLTGINANVIDYVQVAIPFIKHSKTAYINFESFTDMEMKKVWEQLKILLSSDEIKKCETVQHYLNYNKDYKFICNVNTGFAKHLDIGIKQ